MGIMTYSILMAFISIVFVNKGPDSTASMLPSSVSQEQTTNDFNIPAVDDKQENKGII